MTAEVYYSKPDSFKASISVAAIYVRLDQKLLLLQLSTNKSEAGCWGVPAGKLDQDESPIEAAKRELQEETGLSTGSKEAIKEIGSLYMRKPGLDYVYHLFELELTQEPAIRLSAEHCSYIPRCLKNWDSSFAGIQIFKPACIAPMYIGAASPGLNLKRQLCYNHNF